MPNMKTFRNRKFIYFTFRKDLEKFFFLFSSAFQHFPALSVFLASASQSRSLERVKAIFAEKSSRSHFTSRTSLREVESSLRRFSAFFSRGIQQFVPRRRTIRESPFISPKNDERVLESRIKEGWEVENAQESEERRQGSEKTKVGTWNNARRLFASSITSLSSDSRYPFSFLFCVLHYGQWKSHPSPLSNTFRVLSCAEQRRERKQMPTRGMILVLWNATCYLHFKKETFFKQSFGFINYLANLYYYHIIY